MVTGKRPTHALFSEGLDLHKFVEMAVPDRVMDIVDPILLHNDHEALANMAEVFSSLKSIKDTFSMAGL